MAESRKRKAFQRPGGEDRCENDGRERPGLPERPKKQDELHLITGDQHGSDESDHTQDRNERTDSPPPPGLHGPLQFSCTTFKRRSFREILGVGKPSFKSDPCGRIPKDETLVADLHAADSPTFLREFALSKGEEQQSKDTPDEKGQGENLLHDRPPASVPPTTSRTTALLHSLYVEEQNACSSSVTHHSSTAMKDEPTNKDEEVQLGFAASIVEEAEITSENAKTSWTTVLPPAGEEEGDEHVREEGQQQVRTLDASTTQERTQEEGRVLPPRRRNRQFPMIQPGAVHVGGRPANGEEEEGDTVVVGPSGDTVVVVPAYPGFVVAEPQPPDKKHDLVWRAVILCLLVSIAGLALGLGLGLSKKKKNSTNNRAVEGTPPPAPILTKWVMIGQPDDIAGDMEEDYLGIFVAISGDGGTIAATSLYYIAQPYVATFSVTANSTQPLADKIEAPPTTDRFGNGVSLSRNGRLLATGGNGNGNYFYQLGGLLLTESWVEQGPIFEFGSQPALSMDGSTVAVGGIGVKVYRRYDQLAEQNEWSQIGQALSGEIGTRDFFGWSKDLSTNGNRLAVGIPGSLNSTGRVRVFDLLEGIDGAAYWNETGNDLVGIRELDAFGFDLSLSADGSCVAVGAMQNVDFHSGDSLFFTTSSRPGYAQVHCFQGNEWVQRGQTLEGSSYTGAVDVQAGDPRGSWFGHSLHLSGDGRMLVVGAPLAVDVLGVGDEAIGQVSIFRFDDDSDFWIQVAQFKVFGGQLYGCGYSVSMSSGGDVVAVGCPFSELKGHYSGAVRVLREVPCEEEDELSSDNLTPCRQRVGARA